MSNDALLPYVYNGGSFEELYRREYPNLVAVARALTGDRHDGEDLVQDTMVKAFVRWERLKPWLVRPQALPRPTERRHRSSCS